MLTFKLQPENQCLWSKWDRDPAKCGITEIIPVIRPYKRFNPHPLYALLWASCGNKRLTEFTHTPLPQRYPFCKASTVQDWAKDTILCASCSIIESGLFSTNQASLEPRCLIRDTQEKGGPCQRSSRPSQPQIAQGGCRCSCYWPRSYMGSNDFPSSAPSRCIYYSFFHDFLCSFPLLVLSRAQFLSPSRYFSSDWKKLLFSFIHFSVVTGNEDETPKGHNTFSPERVKLIVPAHRQLTSVYARNAN